MPEHPPVAGPSRLASPGPGATPAPVPAAGENGNGAIEPHPTLTDYYPDPAHRSAFIRALFDRTAGEYDRINALFSFGLGRWYRRRALLQAGLRPDMHMLDAGVGTGLLAHEAARIVGPAGAVIGIDVSLPMLQQAAGKGGLLLAAGRCERLPVADASVDFVGMGFALRHVADLRVTFAEFRRVLRPGGRLLVLEVSRPASRRMARIIGAYLGGLVPIASRLATGRGEAQLLMRYYWDTILACADAEVILAAMRQAGLQQVQQTVEYGLFSLYSAQSEPLEDVPAADTSDAAIAAMPSTSSATITRRSPSPIRS